MTPIRLASIAKRDLAQTALWYSESQAGLDRRFESDLNHTFRQIQENPQLYPRIEGEIRRAPLRKFPYGVFYVIRPQEVFVIGIMHLARAPESWKKRG